MTEHVDFTERLKKEILAAAPPIGQIPPTNGHRTSSPRKKGKGRDMADFIEEYDVETYEREDYKGGYKWRLKECPFCHSTDNGPYLYQRANGALQFKCSHDRCWGEGHRKTWDDFREHFEPGYKEKEAEFESVSLQLVKMAEPYLTVFRDTGGARFAKVLIDGHIETMMLVEKGSFRLWLHNLYESETGIIPHSTALNEAINTFAARAQFRTKRRETVSLRVAYVEQTNTIYLDMANDEHQVIEITENGWHILNESPVCFRRSQSMRPLPVPLRGGSVDDLRPFINCRDEDWILIKAFVLSNIQPYGLDFGDYPVLNYNGGQGVAKTSAATRTRSVFDPSVAPLRKKPKDDQTFAIMAHNNFVVGLDNLSFISNELSDSICTLSTGQGDAYRTLYTDADETVFQARRPQIFTGIEQLATRGDLLDRCLLITLKDLTEEQRIDATELNKRFHAAHPRILGAFLDCASLALKNRATVKLKKTPRLADFAMFVVAAEPLIGKPGEFLKAYSKNRTEGVTAEIEASLVAGAVLKLIRREGSYAGLVSDLLEQLGKEVFNDPHIVNNAKAWPQIPRALSAQLKRLARSLRTLKVFVTFRHENDGTHITITQLDPDPSSPSPGSDVPSDGSDAKSDAKSDGSDAKVTQKEPVSVLRHQFEREIEPNESKMTQSDANFCTSEYDENKKNEGKESPYRERAENLRHFTSSDDEAACSLTGDGDAKVTQNNGAFFASSAQELVVGQWVNCPDGVGQITRKSQFSLDVSVDEHPHTYRGIQLLRITAREEVNS